MPYPRDTPRRSQVPSSAVAEEGNTPLVEGDSTLVVVVVAAVRTGPAGSIPEEVVAGRSPFAAVGCSSLAAAAGGHIGHHHRGANRMGLGEGESRRRLAGAPEEERRRRVVDRAFET